MQNWYVAIGGQQQGPYPVDEIVSRVKGGQIPRDAYVFTEGMANWEPIASRREFSAAFAGTPVRSAPPPVPGGMKAHEIDYELIGSEMQFVEITLDPGEACVAEAGAFMYMDPGIQMQTIFGDGSNQSAGLMGKLLQAGKRVLTGESLFMTIFVNEGGGRQKAAFAAPYPGKIVPLDLAQLGGSMICQKDAFLCAAKGISVGIAFQKKIGAGFFGGEGFILEKLDGDGLAFVHAGGTIVERNLKQGETMRLDTGCLVAFQPQVGYDIQFVSGVKTALFGGEGLFFATLTGPGKVWIQSLPFSRFASRVFAAAPQGGGKQVGEGSALGVLGNIMMGGDN